MTNTTAPTVYKRITVDGLATVDGLIETISRISAVAPMSASVVQVAEFYSCSMSDEEHEAADGDLLEPVEHIAEAYLSFSVEWEDAPAP